MQTYDDLGGFNTRRKRQIDLSKVRNIKIEHINGIQWDNEVQKPASAEDELELSWEEEARPAQRPTAERRVIKSVRTPEPSPVANSTLLMDGKPIRIQAAGKEKTFEETHVRFTSYLEHDLHIVVQALKKQGQIRSITELVNESIKHYLTCTEV